MNNLIFSKIRTFLISLFMIAIIPVSAFAEPVGYFSKIEGKVDILKVGTNTAVPVSLNNTVSIGDMVKTKSDGKAEIIFKDDTTIRLAPETQMKIDEYLFNPDNTRNKGVLNLFRGKVRAVVTKVKGRVIPAALGDSTFNIQTPTAIAGVRGTDFFVFHDKGITGVIFKEGSGFVANPNIPEKIVNVNAGYATYIVSPEVPPTSPRPATNVELAQHTKDTTPAEKPKEEKKEEKPKEEAKTDKNYGSDIKKGAFPDKAMDKVGSGMGSSGSGGTGMGSGSGTGMGGSGTGSGPGTSGASGGTGMGSGSGTGTGRTGMPEGGRRR